MKPALVLYFMMAAFLMSNIECLQDGNAYIPYTQLSVEFHAHALSLRLNLSYFIFRRSRHN